MKDRLTLRSRGSCIAVLIVGLWTLGAFSPNSSFGQGLFTCPANLPTPFGAWIPQTYLVDLEGTEEELGEALYIPFIPYSLTKTADWVIAGITVPGKADYKPDNIKSSPIAGIEYLWKNARVRYSCVSLIGTFPSGLWAIFSTSYSGTAIPLELETVTESGSGSSNNGGGGSEGGFCIEYFDWWYDALGHYHEDVTATQCFGEYET